MKILYLYNKNIMKKHYVYELINLYGTVEHVGESVNPKNRYNHHMCAAGKFTNRRDLILNVVDKFDTEREAWDLQCKLQEEYGLKTDREIMSEAMKKVGFANGVQSIGGKLAFQAQHIELKCPHCNHIGTGRIMYRWHFDKCKSKK